MTPDAANAWMDVKTRKQQVSVRAQNRPWDHSFDYARFLLDTYLVMTPLNLGNFYEQYLRALLGAYRFSKAYPRFYPNGNTPTVTKDDQDTMHSIRQRMVEVWKLPVMVLNVPALMQTLGEKQTYEELCTYFLENSPMMQNLLNARRDPNDKALPFRDTHAHLAPTALLDYLRVLLEDVVHKNMVVNQVDRSSEENGAYFKLVTQQQNKEQWRAAFPDAVEGDTIPQIAEFALDSRELFKRSDMVQVTKDIHSEPGWAECMDEIFDGGKRTKNIRARVVQLMLMSNTFPIITEEFVKYYTKQRRLIRRWDSFFNKPDIQKHIFGDAIVGTQMPKRNYELFKTVLSGAVDEGSEGSTGSEESFPAYDPGQYEGVQVKINFFPIFMIGGLAAAFFLFN
jgi:hypothetical protein